MSAIDDDGCWRDDASFADCVARACHKRYLALPKTGKPNAVGEWTLLSAVVMTKERPSVLEVVSLGTGSKCLGRNAMSPAGDVLNDGHAEVVARRSFLRYLYDQVERFRTTGASDVFGRVLDDGRFALKAGVSFHFYTSATPCGDASIFAKANEDDCGNCLSRGVEGNGPDGGASCEGGNVLSEAAGGKDEMNTNAVDCGDGLMHNVAENVPEDVSVCERGDGIENETARISDDSKMSCDNKSVDSDNSIETLETTGTKRKHERGTNGTDTVARSSKQPKKETERVPKGPAKERPANDIHRTGAKCVPSDRQDLRSPGVGYHVLGALRTKPGRGDPTLSLSCSDKLARWNAVGCQGALLSLLMEPVRFRSLIVGGGGPFSEAALSRAVVERASGCAGRDPPPSILRATAVFPHGRPAEGGKLPCASSIAWCRVLDRPLEVSVKGRKQGVTKKVACTSAGRLQICKRELARRFVAVAGSTSPPVAESTSPPVAGSTSPPVAGSTSPPVVGMTSPHVAGSTSPAIAALRAMDLRTTPYGRLKAMAGEYQRQWRATREQCFPAWPAKPASLLEFTLDG